MGRIKAIISLSALGLCMGASRSVWDGVYAKEQATRGQATFNEECARCHGMNLLGGGEGAPELAGDSFVDGWNGRSVGDLFEFSRLRMPPEDPGSLSREEYADVIAYILSVNKFPAGQKNLETEAAALKEIRIEKTK